MEQITAIAIGYLFGSIPFGLLLSVLFGAGDIRQIGSGNIGATNVLRTGRKGLAVATLLLDAGKGFAAVALMRYLHGDIKEPLLAAAIGAMVGHCFPIWLGFKGGKGVATFLGVSLAIWWPIGAVYAAVWLSVLAVTRTSSLGGIAAAISAPITTYFLNQGHRYDVTMGLLAALVVLQHRANIMRLIAGQEPKVGAKDEQPDVQPDGAA